MSIRAGLARGRVKRSLVAASVLLVFARPALAEPQAPSFAASPPATNTSTIVVEPRTFHLSLIGNF